MQNVFLVCCIGVSESEFFSKPLLRHFVEHYLGMGILRENFVLTLHSTSTEDNIDPCVSFLSRYGLTPSAYLIEEYDCYRFYEKDFELMERLPRDAWVILVDFDEFIFFPSCLSEFIEKLEAENYDLVWGKLMDRIGRGGFLSPIQNQTPLWDQFPQSHPITRDIVRGDDQKTCLFRNYLKPNLGHHSIRNLTAARPFLECLAVYHFKWDLSLPSRIEKRIAQFDGNRVRYPWFGELYNLARQIEGERLILGEPGTEP
jgi:hypothetical protein